MKPDSPYLVEREGYNDYSRGFNAQLSIDYDSDTLIYRVDELDPDLEHKLLLGLYQETGKDIKERIEVDGTDPGSVTLTSGKPKLFIKDISSTGINDGSITISIIRESGDYAVCGILYVHEYSLNEGRKRETRGEESEDISSGENIPNKVYLVPSKYGNLNLELGLPDDMKVSIEIYDVTGRCVKNPVNKKLEAGIHRIDVKGLASGVYFYSLKAGNKLLEGKLTNIR